MDFGDDRGTEFTRHVLNRANKFGRQMAHGQPGKQQRNARQREQQGMRVGAVGV
jgi:hypothetical protein